MRPFTVDVGNRTTWDLTGLVDGTPYYFAVRAYNTARQLSGPSAEISKRVGVPSSTRNDFDGDARADLVVYRPNSGGWFFRYSTLNYSSNSPGYLQWGLPTDKPLGADFDGDGKIDAGVFRPSTGEWFIRLSSTGYGSWVYYQWGLPTDVPLVGDFDGDGKADLSVFRPSDGGWYSSLLHARLQCQQLVLPSVGPLD